MHKQPGAVASSLQPFSASTSTCNRNKFKLDSNSANAEERLSGIKLDKKELFNFKEEHVLFCPFFVLDSRLQDRVSLPRWDGRVRADMHVGRSPQHASGVALALNLSTGHMSPQFHVVFDDKFETVEDLEKGIVLKRQNWLCKHKRECHCDEQGAMLDNTKMWTNSKLESSMLFEIPKNPKSIINEDEAGPSALTMHGDGEAKVQAPIEIEENEGEQVIPFCTIRESEGEHAPPVQKEKEVHHDASKFQENQDKSHAIEVNEEGTSVKIIQVKK